jgi:Uma2 family endonuclease
MGARPRKERGASMAQNTLAPWAEGVPGVGPMTVDELLALPVDGWRYELVEGRLVRMPGSGGEASTIAMNLAAALWNFVASQRLGRVTGQDGTYDLTQPGDPEETALVPDVAFVRADRVPSRTSPEYAKAWRLAPDLVAEVVSPSQFRPEMRDKVAVPGRRRAARLDHLAQVAASRRMTLWRASASKHTDDRRCVRRARRVAGVHLFSRRLVGISRAREERRRR